MTVLQFSSVFAICKSIYVDTVCRGHLLWLVHRTSYCSRLRDTLGASLVISTGAHTESTLFDAVIMHAAYQSRRRSSLATCWSAHPVQTVPVLRYIMPGEYQTVFTCIDLLQSVAAMLSRHSVLWSATDRLFVPHTRLVFGERAFRVAALKPLN